MSRRDHSIHLTRWAAGLALLFCVLGGSLADPAAARLVKDPSSTAGPDAVFAAIAAAWENQDEEALADLVHEDGLRVTSADFDKQIGYSPSQAFYYFKNQFRSHPTVSFELERMQERLSGQDRVHGMVVWSYRRAHAESPSEMRLVLVLARQADVWRLAEINTINTR